MAKLKPFDKYYYYQISVQSPEADVGFLMQTYKQLIKKKKKKGGIKKLSLHLREDFSGTCLLCSEWLRQSKVFSAEGFDIDPEPMEWGKQHNFKDISNWHERMSFVNQDVREKSFIRPDIRIAQNFSYCVFKTRELMQNYLSSCYDDLNNDGMYVLDIHGGPESFMIMEEETEHEEDGYSYFWDQDSYSPVTGEAIRKIHYKRKGEKKRQDVFVYDWRMWTVPEMVEMLYQAGFVNVICYWEGTDSDGVSGNGEFIQTVKGSNDLSWVAYIVALKK